MERMDFLQNYVHPQIRALLGGRELRCVETVWQGRGQAVVTGVKLRVRQEEPNEVWQGEAPTEMTEHSERLRVPF